MSKDRLGQEGRDEPEFLKPRISSQVIPSLLSTYWIRVVEAVSLTTLNHGGTGQQVWLPVRDGDGRSWHPSSGIMINSRGERRTKALERTEDIQQTPSKIRSEKPESTDTVTTNHHMRLVEFSNVSLKDSLATGVGLC